MSESNRRMVCLEGAVVVEELIKALSQLDPNAVVLIPSVEGNQYRADSIRIIEEVHAAPIVADKEGNTGLVPADYRVYPRANERTLKMVFIH